MPAPAVPRVLAAAVFLAALPLSLAADLDSAALLRQARSQILANVSQLPRYTCVETVHRTRYDPYPARRRPKSCAELSMTPWRELRAWSDRFKLDVTIAQEGEIFSWAGDRRFQTEDLRTLVGGEGMTGSGDFGPFLTSIFGENGAQYEYAGLDNALAVYRYRIPLAASHYQLRTGPRPQDLATVAYEGRFWIDPHTAQLRRLTIVVPQAPPASETCRLETTIEYRQTRIHGSPFLLPATTRANLLDTAGARHENQIDYGSCREFESESVFRTDIAGPAAAPAPAPPANPPVAIPPGVTLNIALRSRVDSDAAFAGDAIEGELVDAAGPIPKGAVVHGRIVRLSWNQQPSVYLAVGLRFDTVEVNGARVPLSLEPLTRSRLDRILETPEERDQGIGMFLFQQDRVVLDHDFVTRWKTVTKR